MDDDTIQFILNDTEVDPVSRTPFATTVFMLYYGLELEHFLTDISDEFLEKIDLEKQNVGEYSIYKSGSVAQGFYLNTNYLPDARDIDIVTISHRYDIRKHCKHGRGVDEGIWGDVSASQCTHGNIMKHDEGDSSSHDFGKCFHMKTLPGTPPGYVLIERCERIHDESVSERYVSSLKATECRVNFWRDLRLSIKQKFGFKGSTVGNKHNTLFSAFDQHGPAATAYMSLYDSTTPFETDLVFCVQYPLSWPRSAIGFLTRPRPSGWPPQSLIDQIYQDGCTLIPKGEIGSMMEDYEWRISFTGELRLARALNRMQRVLIHALKALISEPQHPFELLHVSTSVESYHLLNLMYRESETTDPSAWVPRNIAKMMFLLLDKYEEHFMMRRLPHYFIETRNVFAKYKDMTADEVDTVLYTVLRIRRDPVRQIIQQQKYTNLPPKTRRWVFEPISECLDKGPYGIVRPICYIQSLVRLVKAHLKQNHYDIAERYSLDLVKFFQMMEVKETSLQDFIDVFLTMASAMHRCGVLEKAADVLQSMQDKVSEEEEMIDTVSLAQFHQLSGRLNFISEMKNQHKRRDLLEKTWCSYIKAMSQPVYTKHIVVEYMYIVLILGGPEEFKVKSVDMGSVIPGAFEDVDNSKDVEIVYDRKQFLNRSRHSCVPIDVERYAREHRVHLSSDLIEDDHFSTHVPLETPIGEYMDMESMETPIGEYMDTDSIQDTTTDTVQNDGTQIQTPIEMDQNSPELQTKSDTGFLTEHEATVPSSDSESLIYVDYMEEGSDNQQELKYCNDRTDMTYWTEEIIYDRKVSRSYSDTADVNDVIDYTEADVNMIDAVYVQNLCRARLFEETGMSKKAYEIRNRIKTSCKLAKANGQKINMEMVEKAYEMYANAAKTMTNMCIDEGGDEHVMEKDVVYFVKEEKPYLDETLREAFAKLNVTVLKIPIDVLLLHTKIIYFTSRNLTKNVNELLHQMESLRRDHQLSDNQDLCDYLLAVHWTSHRRRLGSYTEADECESNPQVELENMTVKQQVLKWIETVFEAVKIYEPKNQYLDAIF